MPKEKSREEVDKQITMRVEKVTVNFSPAEVAAIFEQALRSLPGHVPDGPIEIHPSFSGYDAEFDGDVDVVYYVHGG